MPFSYVKGPFYDIFMKIHIISLFWEKRDIIKQLDCHPVQIRVSEEFPSKPWYFLSFRYKSSENPNWV